MSASETPPLDWPGTGTYRIPFGVYTSGELHRLELERLFYRNHWHYPRLEAEVPQLNQQSTVFNVGRYLDEVVHTPQGWSSRFGARCTTVR